MVRVAFRSWPCLAAWTILSVLALVSGRPNAPSAAAQELAPRHPLVYLRDVDPSIRQDIRYAGYDNFTGHPVPGYAAAECMLLRDVAEALSRVQKQLLPGQLSLQVYDCYRPQRAVRAFVAWVEAPDANPLLKRFRPNVEKRDLIQLGYIAGVSRHSRGDTVDLTLVALPAGRTPSFDRRATYGPCGGPKEARSPDDSVDMGTSFDCFDARSHTAATDLTDEQWGWRRTLVEAMAQEGFRNYPKEWWHFTFSRGPHQRALDVPIVPRQP
jgi:zinc D-Ala-D-Ala dipeptidase